MLLACLLGSQPSTTHADPEPPVIEVDPDTWGSAPASNVEAVLRSSAEALLSHAPNHGIKLIHVRGGAGPITYYARADDGGYQISLNTRDTYWSQYAFQFAHEVCHVLCGYDTVQSGNQFLEESICEVASLFALRQMAGSWRDHAPYPNWSDYASHLASYAQDRLDQGKLPDGVTLAEWYVRNREEVRATGSDREKNLVIATSLLPLFEAEPDHAWEAVRYLNTDEPADPCTLAQHLQRWHDVTPEAHRSFVSSVALVFGITLKDE